VSPGQNVENLRFALTLAIACLERVNANYGKDLHIIDPLVEDDTIALDREIENWGIQGTINESRDALAGRLLEDCPLPESP
jgi:hypothetical protein